MYSYNSGLEKTINRGLKATVKDYSKKLLNGLWRCLWTDWHTLKFDNYIANAKKQIFQNIYNS